MIESNDFLEIYILLYLGTWLSSFVLLFVAFWKCVRKNKREVGVLVSMVLSLLWIGGNILLLIVSVLKHAERI
jgi:heme/copper-type cytochrome/quinol oxidase subunit 2